MQPWFINQTQAGALYALGIRAAFQKIGNRGAICTGHGKIVDKICQRQQNEPAFGQPWMRNGELVGVGGFLSEEKQIQIERPRTPLRRGGIAPRFSFDVMKQVEKILGSSCRAHPDNRIQMIRLAILTRQDVGFGFVDGRDLFNRDPFRSIQFGNGEPKHPEPVAKVAPQPYKRRNRLLAVVHVEFRDAL